MKTRYIVHVDMDAFFASVEQRDNPAYRGKPVIVGSDPKKGTGRGVVSTCSYEARRYGIHSAMPISQAYRRCPHAIFLPVDMERYTAASRQVYEIFYSFTPDIEPVGIDEAFLDISGSYHLFGTPYETCVFIKSRIKERVGLTASIGLAPTKMAAKIASDLKKPDGMVQVSEEDMIKFLWPLEVRRIWGLGPKAEESLARIGVRTIGDLAAQNVRELERLFGKCGSEFWRLAHGIDDRNVESDHDTKSVSNEFTFDEDTADRGKIEHTLAFLAEKVCARLRRESLNCRTVTVKIRLSNFSTFTRSVSLKNPANHFDILYKEVKGLYNEFDRKNRKIRLLGVKASRIAKNGFPGDLFSARDNIKAEKAHAAVDSINKKFGEGSVYHAASCRISY